MRQGLQNNGINPTKNWRLALVSQHLFALDRPGRHLQTPRTSSPKDRAANARPPS